MDFGGCGRADLNIGNVAMRGRVHFQVFRLETLRPHLC